MMEPGPAGAVVGEREVAAAGVVAVAAWDAVGEWAWGRAGAVAAVGAAEAWDGGWGLAWAL